MEFKLWSQSNSNASKELSPDFGFRSWDTLTADDKYKIWQYLDDHFFDKDKKKDYNHRFSDDSGLYHRFYGDSGEQTEKRERIMKSISLLNYLHKARGYARGFLENPEYNTACEDFHHIFMQESEHVVMEVLSIYSKIFISDNKESYLYKEPEELESDYEKRLTDYRWSGFDSLCNNLNEVFLAFGINLVLTRLGFVSRQEQKITEEIYNPVIASLANPKWKEVNRLLSDSFEEYRKNSPTGYSNSVTNAVSAIQAFLQILVNNKTGKGSISDLISEAHKRELIPKDFFTQTILKNIESIFARERQETGVAHPKKDYATEKNARMVLNLAMVFLQHCV